LWGLVFGLFVSIVIGYLIVDWFYMTQWRRLTTAWRGEEGLWDKIGPNDRRAISPMTLGVVERTVFTIAFAIYPSSTLTAMGLWLGLKMATHWNKARQGITPSQQQRTNSYAMLGLLTGLVSLAFAALGGLLTRLMWGWGI
jgi:hypothetical protein